MAADASVGMNVDHGRDEELGENQAKGSVSFRCHCGLVWESGAGPGRGEKKTDPRRFCHASRSSAIYFEL